MGSNGGLDLSESHNTGSEYDRVGLYPAPCNGSGLEMSSWAMMKSWEKTFSVE